MKMIDGNIVAGEFICSLCKNPSVIGHCNGFVVNCSCTCAKLARQEIK